MSIEAACRCGARFRAEPHLYGKEVNCPTCGQRFRVPSPQAAAESKIAVQCSCGAAYQVASSMVGKRVQCQACQQPFVIGAAPTVSDPLAGAALDPFGGIGSDPLAGGMGFPGAGQMPVGGAPFGMPAAPAGGYGAPMAAGSVGGAPGYSGGYGGAPKSRGGGGQAGKAVKIIAIVAIVLIGIAAVGGGGWFAFGMLMGGYRSPEAVYAAMLQARKNEDYEKAFTCLAPDTQNQITAVILVTSAMGSKVDPSFKEILTKNSLDGDAILTKHGMSTSNPFALMSMNPEKAKELAGEVGNRARLFGDFARLSRQKGNMKTPLDTDVSDAPLQDVTYSGDKATGKVVTTIGAATTTRTFNFVRIDGRWYLDSAGMGRLPSGS